MKKQFSKFLAIMLVVVMLASSVIYASTSTGPRLFINGEEFTDTGVVLLDGEPFISWLELDTHADVVRNAETGETFISTEFFEFIFNDNSPYFMVNGERFSASRSVQMIEGTPYIPVQAWAAPYGLSVEWDESTNIVHLRGISFVHRETGFEDEIIPLTPAFIVDGRVLIHWGFDGEGDWNRWEQDRIILSEPGFEIIFTLDSPYFTVNGNPKPLDVPAQLIYGVPFLPIRTLFEIIGEIYAHEDEFFYIEWDGTTNTVYLIYEFTDFDDFWGSYENDITPLPLSPIQTEEQAQLTIVDDRLWNLALIVNRMPTLTNEVFFAVLYPDSEWVQIINLEIEKLIFDAQNLLGEALHHLADPSVSPNTREMLFSLINELELLLDEYFGTIRVMTLIAESVDEQDLLILDELADSIAIQRWDILDFMDIIFDIIWDMLAEALPQPQHPQTEEQAQLARVAIRLSSLSDIVGFMPIIADEFYIAVFVSDFGLLQLLNLELEERFNDVQDLLNEAFYYLANNAIPLAEQEELFGLTNELLPWLEDYFGDMQEIAALAGNMDEQDLPVLLEFSDYIAIQEVDIRNFINIILGRIQEMSAVAELPTISAEILNTANPHKQDLDNLQSTLTLQMAVGELWDFADFADFILDFMYGIDDIMYISFISQDEEGFSTATFGFSGDGGRIALFGETPPWPWLIEALDNPLSNEETRQFFSAQDEFDLAYAVATRFGYVAFDENMELQSTDFPSFLEIVFRKH